MSAQLDKKELLKYLKAEKAWFTVKDLNSYCEAKKEILRRLIYLIKRGDFDTQEKVKG